MLPSSSSSHSYLNWLIEATFKVIITIFHHTGASYISCKHALSAVYLPRLLLSLLLLVCLQVQHSDFIPLAGHSLSLPVVCFCFKAPQGKLPNILCIANVLAHNPAVGRQVNCGLFKLLNLSLEAVQRDALKYVLNMFLKKAPKEIRIDFMF